MCRCGYTWRPWHDTARRTCIPGLPKVLDWRTCMRKQCMAHRSVLDMWFLPVALLLGMTAALSPSALGGVVALCGLIAAGIFVVLQPQKALQGAFCVVM